MRDSLFLSTLSGKQSEQVPFWYMRQAGRYLPEYRALREKAGGFLDLCFTPDWAAEVTLQPIRRFDMDAAILFSDILVIPYAMNRNLRFIKGEGPKLDAIDDPSMIGKLRETWDVKKLLPIMETVKKVRSELDENKALIGFAGAPWTVACYMVEGKGSRDFAITRRFARTHPEAFAQLIEILVDTTAEYLCAQVKAGADVLQMFDSWAGILPASEFKKWVIQPTKKLVEKVREKHPNVPIIGFARTSSVQLKDYAQETQVNALGLDYSVSLPWAAEALGRKLPLQGNLDPLLLATNKDQALKEAEEMLKTMRGKPYIFNLGHGFVPDTPVENVEALSKLVREWCDG